MNNDVLKKGIWYANVLAFRPWMSAGDLQLAYERWQTNRRDYMKLYGRSNLKSLRKDSSQEKVDLPAGGGILMTFHLGPYRLLPRYLLAAGYKVALLASRAVISRERAWYLREMAEAQIAKEHFVCIDACSPLALRTMLNAAQGGYWVIHFIDADEGLLAKEGDYARISLFSGILYWRVNIFRLVDRCKLRLLVAQVSLAGSGEIVIQTAEGLEDVADFFRKSIALDWETWENWVLLHRYERADKSLAVIEQGKPVTAIPIVVGDKKFFLELSSRQFFELK